jgi:E3 ubiquitin-protein ligase RNF8
MYLLFKFQAMTLNCTHTFCKLCITEWKRKQTKRVPDCPVCRSPILSENRSIVLDNFIDKMVENLTDDLKEQRKELLIERGGMYLYTSIEFIS